jgi:hypothetical protein
MKGVLTMKYISFANYTILTIFLFSLFGCNQTDVHTQPLVIPQVSEVQLTSQKLDYGEYTTEIETLLSATPMGAEIYLEEQEGGEWYLKIEKTFTRPTEVQEIENNEPIYAESILI